MVAAAVRLLLPLSAQQQLVGAVPVALRWLFLVARRSHSLVSQCSRPALLPACTMWWAGLHWACQWRIWQWQ